MHFRGIMLCWPVHETTYDYLITHKKCVGALSSCEYLHKIVMITVNMHIRYTAKLSGGKSTKWSFAGTVS